MTITAREYGRHFEATQFLSREVLETDVANNALGYTRERMRAEVFRGIQEHFTWHFPLAMTHIVQWQEVRENVNLWPAPADPPGYLPDLRLSLHVVVEGFDVV